MKTTHKFVSKSLSHSIHFSLLHRNNLIYSRRAQSSDHILSLLQMILQRNLTCLMWYLVGNQIVIVELYKIRVQVVSFFDMFLEEG